MGDAAGELADRLHLLGLAQRLLGRRQGVGALALGGEIAADGVDDPLARAGPPS
ncbi:hypothetical protein ACU4GR_32850 [Methylobacterium oryzae CBMB20]